MKRSSPLLRFRFAACGAVLLAVAPILPHSLGQPADAGQNVFSHPYLGINVDLPDGWNAQVASTGFLLAHDDFEQAIAVLSHEHGSLAAMHDAARKGLHEFGHVELLARQGLTPFQEAGLAGMLEGTAEGEAVRAYAVFLLSPYGGGATVLMPLPIGAAPGPYVDLATTVATGIRFQPRVASDPLAPWKERLLNCRLTHLPHPDAALSSEEEPTAVQRVVLDLCDDGRFHLTLPDNPELLETWTGHGEVPRHHQPGTGVLSGDWFLVRREGRAWLRLDFPAGARREFLLSFPDGSMHLDELHVFRSYADALRIEDLPDCN